MQISTKNPAFSINITESESDSVEKATAERPPGPQDFPQRSHGILATKSSGAVQIAVFHADLEQLKRRQMLLLNQDVSECKLVSAFAVNSLHVL